MNDDDAAIGGQYDLGAEGQPSDLDDMVQVEHEGQIYAIPVALKDSFLTNADHERKAQELAAHARDLDARRRGVAQEVELAEQGLADRAQLHVLDLQLAAYDDVDWRSLAEGDPQRAELLWRQFQLTQAARADLAQAVAQRHDQRRLDAERKRAAQLAEAGQVLTREIEGWSPDVARKLVEYAAAFGVTIDELREVADHRLWRILHRAFQGDEQSKRQAASQSAAQAQAVRPAVMVAGAAAASGGVRDELGTGEWMRRRNSQLARN